MSYALETKKRKWDRLLESFNDRPPSRPATTATPTSSISLIPTFEEELAKKRRLEAASSLKLAANSSTVSLLSNYLPSNRAAFLERLETFRSITKWHIPSIEPINAAEWAKRGWSCVDTDTVACGVCRERVYVKIDIEEKAQDDDEDDDDEVALQADDPKIVGDDESYTAAVGVYEGIVKKFMTMIESAHADGCQWKRRGCDASIQRIDGLLNASNVINNLRNRYDGLASNELRVPDTQPLGEEAEKEIRAFHFDENSDTETNALRLAICGWQWKSEDVFDCRNCFRSLGLWLYRGEQPAMEHLDVVESHLEYCPWRSPVAQDTEIVASFGDNGGNQPTKTKVAGWQLVCHGMKLANAKKERKTIENSNPRPISAISGEVFGAENAEEISPEQREKKMKALLERIKSVKKPFNVKGLLKKKKEIQA